MEVFALKDMIRGWFVGSFEPNVFRTNVAEVAIKEYKQGDYEEKHYHKIATEITAIISGKVKMNGDIYTKGDIIVINPGEATNFEAIEDTISVVVKLPGASNDKYLGDCK